MKEEKSQCGKIHNLKCGMSVPSNLASFNAALYTNPWNKIPTATSNVKAAMEHSCKALGYRFSDFMAEHEIHTNQSHLVAFKVL